MDIKKQLEDWTAAISYAVARDDVDAGRIALWGASFGAGHVVTTAARDSRVAAIIAQSLFADGFFNARHAEVGHSARLLRAGLRDWWRARRDKLPCLIGIVGTPASPTIMQTTEARDGYRILVGDGDPIANAVAARIVLHVPFYRPVRSARRVTCPALIVVGDADVVTYPKPALRVARRAPRAELIRYPIRHFDIYHGEWFEQAVRDEIEFLRRHLRLDDGPVV